MGALVKKMWPRNFPAPGPAPAGVTERVPGHRYCSSNDQKTPPPSSRSTPTEKDRGRRTSAAKTLLRPPSGTAHNPPSSGTKRQWTPCRQAAPPPGQPLADGRSTGAWPQPRLDKKVRKQPRKADQHSAAEDVRQAERFVSRRLASAPTAITCSPAHSLDASAPDHSSRSAYCRTADEPIRRDLLPLSASSLASPGAVG